jgi:hypothetical protein
MEDWIDENHLDYAEMPYLYTYKCDIKNSVCTSLKVIDQCSPRRNAKKNSNTVPIF